jgi:hypothetical protein
MTTRTHVFVVIAALVAVVLILRLVATRQLKSKYALLWLIVAFALLPLAAFPGLLNELADWTGIAYTPTLFLLMALALLAALIGHLTWEVSRLEQRARTLAEEIALIRNAQAEAARSVAHPDGPESDEAT